jgi:S-adenosylmethionine synthetase
MAQIFVETLSQIPIARRRTEHVERKGLGHPDTICDGAMEAVFVALSGTYIEARGRLNLRP